MSSTPVGSWSLKSLPRLRSKAMLQAGWPSTTPAGRTTATSSSAPGKTPRACSPMGLCPRPPTPNSPPSTRPASKGSAASRSTPPATATWPTSRPKKSRSSPPRARRSRASPPPPNLTEGHGPCTLAVDSERQRLRQRPRNRRRQVQALLFPADVAGATTYEPDTTVNSTGVLAAEGANGVAIDPATDNVYVSFFGHISSYEPDGTPISETIGEAATEGGGSVHEHRRARLRPARSTPTTGKPTADVLSPDGSKSSPKPTAPPPRPEASASAFAPSPSISQTGTST